MTVKLRWSDGSDTPVPVQPGWYTEDVKLRSEAENLCAKIVGYALPGKRLLLWLFRNDRPSNDQLQLVLLSVADKHVLDTMADVGEIGYDPSIIKKGGGFSIQLIKEYRSVQHGGGESGVTVWKDIGVENDHIVAAWRQKGR